MKQVNEFFASAEYATVKSVAISAGLYVLNAPRALYSLLSASPSVSVVGTAISENIKAAITPSQPAPQAIAPVVQAPSQAARALREHSLALGEVADSASIAADLSDAGILSSSNDNTVVEEQDLSVQGNTSYSPKL